ncbi:MAG: acyl-CoA carboxylase subunit beta [Anaerolineales bacterium]|nr:acyl-CoA carboxylase subunit beta [Anaerolineales bacterium]
MSIDPKILELRQRREDARLGGGQKRIDQQHAKGKLTARERVDLLLDEGSFQELGGFVTQRTTGFGVEKQTFYGDGVVTGYGTINGRLVYVFSQDFTVFGGSLGEAHAEKICRLMDLAMKNGAPLIGLNDSGGARIQEGVRSLAAYGEVFTRNVLASGVIPQISVIMGPCAGGAVYSPALMDFIVMTRRASYMFITGPEVIKAVTGEDVTMQDLGGTMVHNAKSGVAHLVAEDERAALELVKLLLSYLPQNNTEDPPQVEPYDPADRMDEQLNSIIPEDENEPYDAREMLDLIFDRRSFTEVHPYYSRNAIVGFARLDGYSVGVVANQPSHLAGVLDIDSSDKIARFVRICDAFNIPIVTFVDTPGYLPGVDQEHYGIIRHGAKVIYAYCEATVPKISIVTRKAIGGAYLAMSSKQMRCDLMLAWPTAQIAVMGADGAVRVLYRKELAAQGAQALQTFEREYREKFFNPYMAADLGQIDEIIEPKETRPRLIRALEVLRTKVKQNPPKKHGLMPV